MIGFLRGSVAKKAPPMLLLDVGGVGYEVEAPMSTFYDLPNVGKQVTLHTHFVVREDAQLLYGFYSEVDRDLFRHLLKVNGVGPRMGLAILSTLSTPDVLTCVANNDVVSLTRVPGVGKKTAERLLLDLRDRLDSFEVPHSISSTDAASDGGPGQQRDAISALMALGYKQSEAERAIKGITGQHASTESLIREALRFLAS